jgi:valyl-tRNA synthetase
MPFITEECAQRLPGAAPSLQLRDWPQVAPGWREGLAAPHRSAVDELLLLVQRVRALRDESGVPRGERHRLQLSGGDPDMTIEERVRLITSLVPVEVEEDGDQTGGVSVVAGGLQARYHLVVGERERARTLRRINELEATIERLEKQLATPAFTGRARPEVVTEARRRLTDARREQSVLRAEAESR